MPYSRTQAKTDALIRIKELRVPFVYVKLRTRKIPTVVRDSVLRYCVFQLCALFEDYLSQIIIDWLSRLKMQGASNKHIPLDIRITALLKAQEEAFRNFIVTKNEVKLAEAVLKERIIFSIMDDSATTIQVDLGSIILKGKKFPSPKNLSTLFRRVGIQKIHSNISKRTRSNFELNLQSFMDVRNALAHESPPSITDIDVDRYFKQVVMWIDAVDREMYSHVVKISGASYW